MNKVFKCAWCYQTKDIKEKTKHISGKDGYVCKLCNKLFEVIKL